MLSKNMVLLGFLCNLGQLLFAQNDFPPFTVTKVTTDDGLSQGSNYFRYEDSRGFMWATGNDALNRYDGSMVKVYNLAKYFSNCPTLQQGYGFAEDDAANLYVGSTRGLYIYHRNQDKFTLQPVFSQTSDSVAMPFAFRDGKIWCFNKQFQLATYNIKTKAINVVAQLDIEPLTSVHIYDLSNNAFYYRYPFMDKKGKIWAIGKTNIVTYDSKTAQIAHPFEAYISQKKPIFYCVSNCTGKLICGTTDGLVIFNTATAAANEIKVLNGKRTGVILHLAANDSLIVFSCEYGIAYLTVDYKKMGWLDKTKAVEYSQTLNYSFDKSGRLWLCDDGWGLLIFDFTHQLFFKEPKDSSPDKYKIGLGCYSFAELNDGNVMVRHNIVLDPKTKNLIYRPFSFTTPSKISVFRLCTDHYRKGVWIYKEHIVANAKGFDFYFYTNNSERIITVQAKGTTPHSPQNDMVVLDNGRILCTVQEGLFWLDPEAKTLEKVAGSEKTKAFKINSLSQNRLAVSYLESDMLLYKILPDNSLEPLQTILPGVQAFYIQEDTIKRCYWAGTNAGVYLLDNAFKVVKRFDANNGLAGTHIYGLLLDAQGNVYCSHQRGLSSINAQNYQITNFNKSDGIQDWDFNNRGFLKASDGTLYFGGGKGLNYFKPPLLHKTYYQPEVYVDEIKVGQRPYLPDTSANTISQMELSFNENDISIKALVKDLGNTDLHQLIYRMAETDSEWIEMPNNSSINFNQLAPGSYTLQLGFYNRYVNEKKAQKTIRIIIAAPFYRKIWFWVAIAILVTAAAFRFINRQKLARQKVKFQEQLALEKQRQKITADLHDDIGASLSSLQINSAVAGQLLASDKTAAKGLLTKIEEQARGLADKIGDIVWSMKPGKDEFMTLSRRVKNFASEILSSGQMAYTINIDPAVDSLAKDIALRKNVVLIMKEAINNAAKYSQAGRVAIGIEHSDGHISLKVVDDGVGFTLAEATGNGIDNMRKRAAELGGTLTVRSAPGKGTEVAAQIPLVP